MIIDTFAKLKLIAIETFIKVTIALDITGCIIYYDTRYADAFTVQSGDHWLMVDGVFADRRLVDE